MRHCADIVKPGDELGLADLRLAQAFSDRVARVGRLASGGWWGGRLFFFGGPVLAPGRASFFFFCPRGVPFFSCFFLLLSFSFDSWETMLFCSCVVFFFGCW